MGQVPKYLIVGSGRLAAHLGYYFHFLGLSPIKWSRNNSPQFNSFSYIKDNQERFKTSLNEVTHILLAISDDSIEDFYRDNGLKDFFCVHFSGCQSFSNIYSAHPLMTFTNESAYSYDEYRKVPFITEEHNSDFSQVFPHFKNPSYKIPKEKKALYHSLCVVTGNFTNILWTKLLKNFEKDFGLPPKAIFPFIQKTVDAFTENPEESLTGPIAREDQGTISKNLESLEDHNLKPIYLEMLNLYQSRSLNEHQ